MSAISATEKVDGFTRKSMRKAQKQKKSQGSSQFRTQTLTELSPLPQLKDAPSTEQQELFTQKLQQCCMLFDFMDSVTDLKSKEIKRATLNELVDYVSTNRGVLVETAYPEISNMPLPVMPEPRPSKTRTEPTETCSSASPSTTAPTLEKEDTMSSRQVHTKQGP